MLWWDSYTAAEWYAEKANFWLIIALGAVAILTLIVVSATNEKEHHWERDREATRHHLTELEASTAAANVEQARLSKESEALRAANLALEAKLAPRRITADQQQTIAKALEPVKGKSVLFDSYILDVEAAGFGEQIAAALAKADIKVDTTNLRKRIPAGTIADGVKTSGRDQELVAALLAAFASVGVASAPGEPTEGVAGIRTDITIGGTSQFAPRFGSIAQPRWDATVFIGVKPLAL